MRKIVQVFLESIDSTNSFAKKHRKKFDKKDITCVIADEQTDGYGYFARKWITTKGKDLAFTLYFRCAKYTQNLSQIMALSIISVLKEVHPKIKWPNDILMCEKKAAGILVEIDGEDLFLGVGININSDKDDLSSVDQPVTSVKIESGREWDRMVLLKEILKNFLENLELLEKEGFLPFKEPLWESLAWKGKLVSCGGSRGIIRGVSSAGELILELEDGSLKTILSGTLKKN